MIVFGENDIFKKVNSPLSILVNRGEVMEIGWHIIYQCWQQPKIRYVEILIYFISKT